MQSSSSFDDGVEMDFFEEMEDSAEDTPAESGPKPDPFLVPLHVGTYNSWPGQVILDSAAWERILSWERLHCFT